VRFFINGGQLCDERRIFPVNIYSTLGNFTIQMMLIRIGMNLQLVHQIHLVIKELFQTPIQ